MVGDDDGEQTRLVEALDGGGSLRQEAHLRWTVEVGHILDQGAIPVEEDGAPLAHSRSASWSARATAGKASSSSVRGSSRRRSPADAGDDRRVAHSEPQREAIRPQRTGVERDERRRQRRARKGATADRGFARLNPAVAPAGTRLPDGARARPAPPHRG